MKNISAIKGSSRSMSIGLCSSDSFALASFVPSEDSRFAFLESVVCLSLDLALRFSLELFIGIESRDSVVSHFASAKRLTT